MSRAWGGAAERDGVSGRVCLVTGATSGIGAATARALAARGADLLLTGRDAAALADVAAVTQGRARTADAGHREELVALADWALEVGPPDVVVLSAGVGWAGPLEAMPADRVCEVLGIDLVAPVQLTRLLLPALRRARRSHLVFVSSVAGTIGVRNEAVYAAAKTGLRGFADSLRWELAGSGISVSTIVPGVVETPFFERRGAPYDRRRPRPVPPERLADAIVGVLDRPRAEVFVPRWLRLPARLHGLAPAATTALSRRLG